jgi:FlaA1/EpsC-like NDP-sugar epimerase
VAIGQDMDKYRKLARLLVEMAGKDFSSVLNGRSVFITGGTGSFGHQVVNALLNYNPKQIIIFSRDEDKQHKMRSEYNQAYEQNKIKFILGDVRDFDRVLEVTTEADIILHAAALKHVPYCEYHPYEAVKTNILGAYNVRRAAIQNNVQNVIGISTDKAVKPVNAMGMSKALQEKTLVTSSGKEHNTIFACVRYGNVIGSRGSIAPLFEQKITKREPVPITHPEMTRFMLTLQNAIELVFYALANAKGGEIFVKKSSACKIVNFARVFAEALTGVKDYPVEFVGIRPGEKMHEIIISEEEMRRVNETNENFIIQPHKEFFNSGTLTSKPVQEYASNTATQLDDDSLLKILKETKWIQ